MVWTIGGLPSPRSTHGKNLNTGDRVHDQPLQGFLHRGRLLRRGRHLLASKAALSVSTGRGEWTSAPVLTP